MSDTHEIEILLVEEVLDRQSKRLQTFLLYTSILDRLCGPLCEALLLDPPGSGQETLEHLERANLAGVNGLTWEQGEDAYTDENTILPAFRADAVPLDVLVTDTDFKSPSTWDGWEMDPIKFPDPKAFFDWSA